MRTDFKRLLPLLALSALLPAACAGAQSLLVVNQSNATLSVIDPVAGKEVAVIAENTPGVHAHEVIASPDGKTVWLPIYGSTGVGNPGIDGHQILVIDLPSRKITGTIDFDHGVRPHMPLINPATGQVNVTTELDKTITIIDPKTEKVVGSVPTGAEQSHMFILSHDGKRGYTTNVGAGSVSVLDMAGRKTIAVIPISRNVQRIAISNDDKLIFTSDQAKPDLVVIDTATNTVKTTIPLPARGYGAAPTKDGRFLLIAMQRANQVAVVDLGMMAVAQTIDVPPVPQEVLITPDGKTAYVSCNTSGQVAEIDVATMKVRRLITVGPGADGLAWAK
ncbi:MAG TPA: cytochrome D1 domain-containing protein [Acidobacteriaceae bacterium]